MTTYCASIFETNANPRHRQFLPGCVSFQLAAPPKFESLAVAAARKPFLPKKSTCRAAFGAPAFVGPALKFVLFKGGYPAFSYEHFLATYSGSFRFRTFWNLGQAAINVCSGSQQAVQIHTILLLQLMNLPSSYLVRVLMKKHTIRYRQNRKFLQGR